mmetsp:Transcript_19536/g.53500  ORF Transcript_19536/g.53500 Transcript_19536/m.53500 type:complete len:569 (-) Transcript_19536:73-1779(-)
MATCAGAEGGAFNNAAEDMELLRQRVIVHLLRQVSMAPEVLYNTCRQLMQSGVLTREVLPELRSVCARAVEAALPAFAQPAGALAVGVRPSQPPSRLGQQTRFDHEFERLELLGRGAFGEVWRCTHRLDGREYAVKSVQYRADVANANHVEHRVLREAQTWAGMHHTHIVRYHNAWVEVEGVFGDDAGNHGGGPNVGLVMLPPAHVDSEARLLETADSRGSSVYEVDCTDSGVVFQESADGASSTAAAHTPSNASPLATPIVEDMEAPVQHIVPRRGAVVDADLARKLPGRRAGYKATLYIQTEVCSKDTLAIWISKRNVAFARGVCARRDHQCWAREACRIFRECTDAVAHLHARNCVHRDLKPSNVLFARDGGVRLGDFGLAKVVDVARTLEDGALARDGHSLLSTSAIAPQHTLGAGTPRYASPEQLTGGSVGVRSDIYALGILLAEMLTPVRTEMELAAILEDLRLGRWALGAPSALPATTELVRAMTHADPAMRPAASEVLRACSDVADEVERYISNDDVLPNPALETNMTPGAIRGQPEVPPESVSQASPELKPEASPRCVD